MNLSIEYLTTNVYLCRWHPEKPSSPITGCHGDPYIASCVIHYIDHLPYVKGLVCKEGKVTLKHLKELKESIGVEHLYFERDNTHKEKLRKV